MTLTIEDGSGVESADSYVTISEADEYIADWHDSPDWASMDSAAKERSLRRGARYIDSHRFAGWPTWLDQRRAFPRTGIPREGGYVGHMDGGSPGLTGQAEAGFHHCWPGDEVPQRVKEAQIEVALRDAQGEDLLPDHDGATVERESKGVGSLKTDVAYRTPKSGRKTYEAIRALLQPFLSSSGGSGSLSRVIA